MSNDFARSILVIEPGFDCFPDKPYERALKQCVEHLNPFITFLISDFGAKICGISPYKEKMKDFKKDIEVTADHLLTHNMLRGIGRVLNDSQAYSDETGFTDSLLKDCPQLAKLDPKRIREAAGIAFEDLYASVNGGNCKGAMILGQSLDKFPTAAMWVDRNTIGLDQAERMSIKEIYLPSSATIPGVPALSRRIALAGIGNRPTATSPGQRL